MLRYTTDRARPGLVTLYDIRPGNGAGQFLQPRTTHGAQVKPKHRPTVKQSMSNNLSRTAKLDKEHSQLP